MYNSDLFKDSKMVLENCAGVRQFFSVLPEGTQLRIVLDERLPCTLLLENSALKLLPQDSSEADIEITLLSESIRILRENPPANFLVLFKVMGECLVAGFAKIKFLKSATDYYSKGYLHALQGAGPELQKELTMLAIKYIGKANQAAETIKNILKR